MIGQVRAPTSPSPVFRLQPLHAPTYRLRREVEILGAPPDRQSVQLTPIGRMGTRIDLKA